MKRLCGLSVLGRVSGSPPAVPVLHFLRHRLVDLVLGGGGWGGHSASFHEPMLPDVSDKHMIRTYIACPTFDHVILGSTLIFFTSVSVTVPN
jgi:hypothetical protein